MKPLLSRALLLALGLALPLAAQDTAELLRRMKAMEERIQALEAEVRTLRAQPAPASVEPPPPAPVAPVPEPTLGGAGAASAKILNPDISVIGDFTAAAGNHAGRPTPSLEMHESEVGFQEVIDPYARADFFISFGEKGVDLEEGYLTFTSLPAALQLRAGKMRAAFGKVNTIHNHALPWVDRPLVSQNLLAGEEGLNDAGLSLSRIFAGPKGLFLEGTAQLYRGDTDGVFQASRRSELATVEHLRAYRDLSESTNLDLGASFARGRSPFAPGWNQLYGFDTTLRWKPLRRAIYNSFIARGEAVWGPAPWPPPASPPRSIRRDCSPPSATTFPANTSSAAAGSSAPALTAASAAPASPPRRKPPPPATPPCPAPRSSTTPAAPCSSPIGPANSARSVPSSAVLTTAPGKPPTKSCSNCCSPWEPTERTPSRKSIEAS